MLCELPLEYFLEDFQINLLRIPYVTTFIRIYLYSTKRECCDEHYSWNLECMDGSVGNTGRKYYPDWTGDDICKNDGEGPTHMTLNPSIWLHDTLSECCMFCGVDNQYL